MAKIEQIQMSDYTIFRQMDMMQDDVLVKPHECRGADVILVTSFFMDYGHVQQIFTIDEEQYKALQQVTTTDELDAFLATLFQPDLCG
jgi:hypothetical protein